MNQQVGGTWTEDFRHVAKSYYNGNRPAVPDDCPTLLAKLMAAGWAAKQEDRPKSSYLLRLADELQADDWLAPPQQQQSYDDWLAALGMQDKKDDLYEYDIREGQEPPPLQKLKDMLKEEEDFKDMIEDVFEDDDDAQAIFKAAVVTLSELQPGDKPINTLDARDSLEQDPTSEELASELAESKAMMAKLNEQLVSELAESKATMAKLEARLVALEKRGR